jgi:hypothetical protein
MHKAWGIALVLSKKFTWNKKTLNNQPSITEEQSQRTNITQLQDLL